VQLRLLLDAQADEDEHLAQVGRAAVTGRRALAVLRDALATSVPDLSERLSLSRPAAGAALERLVELGLAEEVTGRARDRVFVYAAAWGLV
jgi:DNA-binding MarR family transcriptional regulator